jgi:hypothetical protein
VLSFKQKIKGKQTNLPARLSDGQVGRQGTPEKKLKTSNLTGFFQQPVNT